MVKNSAPADIFDLVFDEIVTHKPPRIEVPAPTFEDENALAKLQENLSGLMGRVQVRKKARSRMTEYLSKIVRAELEKIKPQEVIERQVEQIVKHETTVKHEQVPVHLEPKIVEAPPQIIREVRVEVQVDKKREAEVADLKKKISKLEKGLDNVNNQPIYFPGGSGVIGIPPPEGNNGKVLTVSNSKASWVTPEAGSSAPVGSTIAYNEDGTINTITKDSGRVITMGYTAGVLTSVSDGTITKTLVYTDGKLTSVTIS